MVFGRCFEKALTAYFERQDCAAALFKEWYAFRDTPFVYWKENPGIGFCTKESTCYKSSYGGPSLCPASQREPAT